MAKYICPYCMEEHLFSEVEFRCININPSDCPEADDSRYKKYLGMSDETVVMRKITFPSKAKIPFFLKNKYMPDWEMCPYCGRKSTVRICPSCHNELPKGISDNENIIIAILGSRDAGKTHFISVLIDQLQNRICPTAFNGTFNPLNDDIQKHYESDFYNKVFRNRELNDLTLSGNVSGESAVRKPLIYEMTVPLGKNGEKNRNFTFVFYDAAGEDLKNEMVMKTVNKYICKASGIIFLLDPMQLQALRFNMNEEELKSSSSIRDDEIEPQTRVLQRISTLIREDNGILRSDKVAIPTAIAFSKFDVLERFFPKDNTVIEPSGYLQEDGKFNGNECSIVNSEIKAMLEHWGAKEFTINVDRNFSKYTYCTLSALGQKPVCASDVKMIEGEPMPHRIEDPFLWILKENGILE